jgi:hypothetical protein
MLLCPRQLRLLLENGKREGVRKMRLFNLKSFVGLAVFGMQLMLGTNDANAQGWGQISKNQRQAIKQQQKAGKGTPEV